MLDVVAVVSNLLTALLSGLSPPPAAGNDCFVLKNGTQYNIISADGRFAVVDTNKRLAFLQQVPASSASKFTAVAKSCNVFGFCVDGFCMSRCEGCTSDSGDFETVSFHQQNSDFGYSQWTLIASTAGGPYAMQVDNKSFLASKQTSAGDQLTLATDVSDKTIFNIVQV